jgi:hypothetical protein
MRTLRLGAPCSSEVKVTLLLTSRMDPGMFDTRTRPASTSEVAVPVPTPLMSVLLSNARAGVLTLVADAGDTRFRGAGAPSKFKL